MKSKLSDQQIRNIAKRLKGQLSDPEQDEMDLMHEIADQFSGYMIDTNAQIERHIKELAPYLDRNLMSTLKKANEAVMNYIDEYETKIGGDAVIDPPDSDEYYENRFYE